MVYQWRVSKYTVTAQAAAQELQRIERLHQSLRPRDVVEASRDPGAPLHACFTWDDTSAAEKLRRREAADLIRNLQVSTLGCPPVNAFQSVRDGKTQRRGYRSVSLVLSDPSLRDQPSQEARRAVRVAIDRHGSISALTGAYRAVELLREDPPHS